jgi:tetratricopeptide (TPR) repeat protein
MLMDMGNGAHFDKLVALTKQYQSYFPIEELKDLYSYAINYCIRRVNQGAPEFLDELFKQYLKSLEAGTLMDDGYLSPWAYKNLIGVGLRLKKFDWTEDFIRQYNEKLVPDFRANALHYNLAELYYYKKDHDQALTHLNKVEFSDIYYNLDTKKMMLKIYFELDEIDALLSLLASFKMFLKRTKLISAANKVAYLNFVQALTLLARKERRVMPTIEKMLASPEPLGDRAWLKQMVQQMPVY